MAFRTFIPHQKEYYQYTENTRKFGYLEVMQIFSKSKYLHMLHE